MKLKYKTHAYQTAAVQAVADCFKGPPPASALIVSIRTPETEVDLYNAVAAQIPVPVIAVPDGKDRVAAGGDAGDEPHPHRLPHPLSGRGERIPQGQDRADRDKIKQVTVSLLARLEERKQEMLNLRDRASAQAKLKATIIDAMLNGMPDEFSSEEIDARAEILFRHVGRQLAASPSSGSGEGRVVH